MFRLATRPACRSLPVAARSGKSGGSLALAGGIAVSLERMSRVLEISPEDLTARVQPGVVTGELQRQVEAHGLFYPPDPNSLDMCTIGGNVAENAGGRDHPRIPVHPTNSYIRIEDDGDSGPPARRWDCWPHFVTHLLVNWRPQ